MTPCHFCQLPLQNHLATSLCPCISIIYKCVHNGLYSFSFIYKNYYIIYFYFQILEIHQYLNSSKDTFYGHSIVYQKTNFPLPTPNLLLKLIDTIINNQALL